MNRSSKLRYSFNSFDRNNDLLEKNEQNILLYWKYYQETFLPNHDHRSNELNTLNKRLLQRCRWHDDTDFLSGPEILFLLISFPVVYYKKDLPGIMSSQIANSYDPTTISGKIAQEIYAGYFHSLYEEKKESPSGFSSHAEIRESLYERYGIAEKDIEWIESNIIQVHNWYSTNLQREGKSVISPQKNRPKVWLNFISTIFKEMQPEDFWYICCLQNLDLRKTEANNDLHAMLKKIVILLSPDFSFFEQIINGLDKFEEVQIDKGEILYSTDVTYQEIIFKNRIYKFGYKQGQVIRLLHECFLGEKSESLSWEDDIKSHPSVQCERKSLSQLFQDRASYYKEVIQPLPKGRYALNTQ
jgi:hypothetical protein